MTAGGETPRDGNSPQTWRTWPSKVWHALNGAALVGLKVIVIGLVVAVVYDYFHEGMVIRPFSVPKALSDVGITDVVAADELRQRIYAIRQSASLNDKAKMPVALSADQPDIAVPTTGISVNTVLDILADVIPRWNLRTVISGEFTGDANQLQLVVLMNGRQITRPQPPLHSRDLVRSANSLIDAAADAVVAVTHPDWEALDLDQHGRVHDADRLMDAVIYRSGTSSSEVAEGHLLRGMFLREEQSPDAACEEFQKALSLDPKSPDVYRNISMLLLDDKQGPLATSEAWKAVILSWGRNSWDYYALGTSYYERGKWSADAGANALDKLGKTKSPAEKKKWIGAQSKWYADALENWREAEDAYGQAIHLWFENRFAHDALGLVNEAEGHYKEALAEFNTAVALNDSFADALDDRGQLRLNKIKTREALEEANEDFVEAHQAAPGLAWPNVGLGYVNYKLKKYDIAAKDFLSALRQDPNQVGEDAAYHGALASIDFEPWARSKEVQADLDILYSQNACAMASRVPAEVAGQTILHDLANLKCRMDVERRMSRVPQAAVCLADKGQVSLVPSEIGFYSFAAMDKMKENARLATSILLACAGVAFLSWRRFHRTVRPKGRETASDKAESTDRRGPEE